VCAEEKERSFGSYSKGQFYGNTVYLERGMPYFAFVSENAVLVGKIDKSLMNPERAASS